MILAKSIKHRRYKYKLADYFGSLIRRPECGWGFTIRQTDP